MAVFILPTEQAERKPQPDLALGDTLPALKPRRCLGCGKPWIGGHSCLAPATAPTTDTGVHEAGVTRLYEDRPNSAGQYVWLATYLCGCTRIQCCRAEEVMLQERAAALETRCPTCLHRARRSEVDEEQARG